MSFKNHNSTRSKSQSKPVKTQAKRRKKIPVLPLLSRAELVQIELFFHPERERGSRRRWVQLAFELPKVGLFRDAHLWLFESQAGVVMGRCTRCGLVVASPVPSIIRECRLVGEVRS